MGTFPIDHLGAINNGNWQAAQAAHNSALARAYSAYSGAAYGSLGQAQQAALAAVYTAPSEPIENAGIGAGEIVAWRTWRVAGGLLKSVSADAIWSPDEPMMAREPVGDHNSSGIYAWKRQTEAFTTYVNVEHQGPPVVVGSVRLWGEVIEHEHGYRAQYARVASLTHIFGGGSAWSKGRRLRLLREAYHLAQPGT